MFGKAGVPADEDENGNGTGGNGDGGSPRGRRKKQAEDDQALRCGAAGVSRAIAIEIVRMLTEAAHPGKKRLRCESRRTLFPQVLRIALDYIRKRVDLNGLHPCDIGLQTCARRIVDLLVAAIMPDDSKDETPLLPRLNRYRPVGSTGSVHFETVKPVQATVASHLNHVACDTGGWEQAAAFRLEKLAKGGVVHCYARNDHLEFNIPFELYGAPRAYEPDFIVRLANGVSV